MAISITAATRPISAGMSHSLLFPVVAPAKAATRFTGGRLLLSPCSRTSGQVRLCFASARSTSQAVSTLSELLDRRWMLPDVGAIVNRISLDGPSISNDLCPRPLRDAEKGPSFYVIRDDLLHPVINGNKARKLDAVMPILQDSSATHVVTCGGCQSAHTAAVAIACAERGIRSHLLLRGEQPEIPTGYNLMSAMFGDVTHIPRSQYADREEMLRMHASAVAGPDGSVFRLDDLFESSFDYRDPAAVFLKAEESVGASFSDGVEKDLRKVVIISEGAGNVVGLLGVIRLVRCLSQHHLIGKEEKVTIVVDAGTGTTAVGLAIGAMCLGLPWKIVAVMLAENIEGYKRRESNLIEDFKRIVGPKCLESNALHDGIVCWVDRIHRRRFGRVEKGEVEVCRQIAQQTGILVDPIYTLAAWEHAMCLCQAKEDAIMLHTGGTLNMFGLAQRYKSQFHGSSWCNV